MPFTVKCNLCGKSKQAPDSYDGKKVKCKCGNSIIANKPKVEDFNFEKMVEEPDPTAVRPDGNIAETKSAPRRGYKANKKPDFFAAVIGVFSLIGFGLSVLVLFGSETVFQQIIASVWMIICAVFLTGAFLMSRATAIANLLRDIRDRL